MPLIIGTSGWQYRSWRGRFYPEKLAQKSWLEHYAARFKVVEINNTFYRLPPPETFAAWQARTPADFVFVPKASRYLTHIKRLNEPAESVGRFLDHAKPLGSKMGPVLVQLPPTLAAEAERLDETLSLFGRAGVRVAVEPRHATWFTDEIRDLLSRHGAALCMADRLEQPVTPIWRTAPWTYLRFHEGYEPPRPCYRRDALVAWIDRLGSHWSDDDDVFVFFNNDPEGCAIRDAIVFSELASDRGWTVTRVPSMDEAPVGDEPLRVS